MKLDTKASFSKSEEIAIAATVALGNMAYRGKLGKHPDRFFTARQLCERAGLQEENMTPAVRQRLDSTVSQVCRAGSRFTKDCICVQLYTDGPQIIRWAMEHGALLCVTRYQVDDLPCIVVEDPAAVYADMCGVFRERSAAVATAITGSIGKTTAKKMINDVYRQQFETFCDAGNDNQLDGIGYISQHIPKKSQLWVQEVSEDTKGMVTHISRLVQPRIAVITAVDKSHIEEFGDEAGILDEVRSVVDGLQEDGICITSIDDANTAELIRDKRVVSVSMKSDQADYYSSNVKVEEEGLTFDITERATGKVFPAILKKVYGEHNVYSALYAFAAGVYSGVTYENILRGLAAYKATGVRQNIYTSRGITVYADCYNAVAKSVRSAVLASEKIPVKGKRIAVLGDIAEAGAYAEQTHAELIEIVNDSSYDVLFAFGKEICKAAGKCEVRPNLQIVCCNSRQMLHSQLRKTMAQGDLVLFKASHSGGLEKTLRSMFPVAWGMKAFEYYWPQLVWRFGIIFW